MIDPSLLKETNNISSFKLKNFFCDNLKQEVNNNLVNEIYRDLSINYNLMMKMFIKIGDNETAKKEMKLSVQLGKKCINLIKISQNYETYISNLYDSINFSNFIKDSNLQQFYLFEYISIIPEAVRNGFRVSSEYWEILIQYLELIKNEPEKGEEALKMINEFTYSIQSLDDLYILEIWGDFTFRLFLYYLENKPNWKHSKKSVVNTMLDFFYNYTLIVKAKNKIHSANFIVPFLVKIQKKISTKEEFEFLLKIFNELIETTMKQNEFNLTINYLEEAIKLVKNNPKFFSEITLIELYQKLIVAYSESDRFKEAQKIYNNVKNIIKSLKWNELINEEFKISEIELESEIQFQKFQLYFNIGLKEYYQKNLEQSKKDFNKAKKYFDLIDHNYYQKKSLEDWSEYYNCVSSLINSSQQYLDLKGQNKHILQIIDKLDKALDKIFTLNSPVNSQEEKLLSLEAAYLLNEIGKISIANLVIKPKTLLAYYYYTLQILDHKEDLSLTTEILENAVRLDKSVYDSNYIWTAWIFFDAACYIPEEASFFLKRSIREIEKHEGGPTLTGENNLFIASVYSEYAKNCIENKRYYRAKHYAQKAEKIFKINYFSGRTYLEDQLKKIRETINKINDLENN